MEACARRMGLSGARHAAARRSHALRHLGFRTGIIHVINLIAYVNKYICYHRIIEVLRSRDEGIRLAPLFDNGVSFVFSCYGDEQRVQEFDPLQDVRANNFIGTRSLEENLQFVPGSLEIASLEEGHRDKLFAGLEDVLPQTYFDAMWNMIWSRWNHWQSMSSEAK